MAALCHIIYTSRAAHGMSEEDIAALLQAARTSNRRDRVTGILLHMEGTFFQVLEGESDVVQALFERICHDSRHTEVTTIIHESIARRAFRDWTMGYDIVSERDLEVIFDTAGTHGREYSVSRLREGRARKLLNAFSEGRWRKRLLPTLSPLQEGTAN